MSFHLTINDIFKNITSRNSELFLRILSFITQFWLFLEFLEQLILNFFSFCFQFPYFTIFIIFIQWQKKATIYSYRHQHEKNTKNAR